MTGTYRIHKHGELRQVEFIPDDECGTWSTVAVTGWVTYEQALQAMDTHKQQEQNR